MSTGAVAVTTDTNVESDASDFRSQRDLSLNTSKVVGKKVS